MFLMQKWAEGIVTELNLLDEKSSSYCDKFEDVNRAFAFSLFTIAFSRDLPDFKMSIDNLKAKLLNLFQCS